MVCLFHTPGFHQPSRIGQTIIEIRFRIRARLSAGMVAVVRAHVAQSVEHLHGKEKVTGSIPVVGSICTRVGAPSRGIRVGEPSGG